MKKLLKRILPKRCFEFIDIIKMFPRYIKSKFTKVNFRSIKFYTDEETVNQIVNNKKSLTRFGDGEFAWMNGLKTNSFQNYSEGLANDLIKTFTSNNEKLLIGIPYGLFNTDKMKLRTKMHWSIIKADLYSKLEKFVDFDKIYCNASITRPYIDYKDYKFSTDAFNNIKRIWNNRDIVIVEGEKTKLGLGNDLFNNSKSIKRIICPAVNAYERLSEIEECIEQNVDKNTLLIAALGPSASILTSHLCDKGYQMVDIGHIDIEYFWYLNHCKYRTDVPGKYVNEIGKTNCSNVYDDEPNYLNSIIKKII